MDPGSLLFLLFSLHLSIQQGSLREWGDSCEFPILCMGEEMFSIAPYQHMLLLQI